MTEDDEADYSYGEECGRKFALKHASHDELKRLHRIFAYWFDTDAEPTEGRAAWHVYAVLAQERPSEIPVRDFWERRTGKDELPGDALVKGFLAGCSERTPADPRPGQPEERLS